MPVYQISYFGFAKQPYQISDAEVRVLHDFLLQHERLCATEFVANGSHLAGWVVCGNDPALVSHAQFSEFAQELRMFLLKKESTYYRKILKIVCRKNPLGNAKDRMVTQKSLRSFYDDLLAKFDYPGAFGRVSSNGLVWSESQLWDTYLYGFFFHRDPDKRAILPTFGMDKYASDYKQFNDIHQALIVALSILRDVVIDCLAFIKDPSLDPSTYAFKSAVPYRSGLIVESFERPVFLQWVNPSCVLWGDNNVGERCVVRQATLCRPQKKTRLKEYLNGFHYITDEDVQVYRKHLTLCDVANAKELFARVDPMKITLQRERDMFTGTVRKWRVRNSNDVELFLSDTNLLPLVRSMPNEEVDMD